MAPPGVNTFYDHLDMMTVSSNYRSPLVLNSPFTSSLFSHYSQSLSLPLSPSFSSTLITSVVHFDHDYVLKPAVDSGAVKPTMTPREESGTCLSDDGSDNNENDAMLSSCAIVVDSDTTTEAGGDTDFLQDLDDLDFSLEDLDPCKDVAMEDSFQEFIDSALDKPYNHYLETEMMLTEHGQHDAVILSKEEFLGMLNLKPSHRGQVTERLGLNSPAAAAVVATEPQRSTGTAPYLTFSPNSSSSFELVPTKMCSCSSLDNVSRVVYSTAHSGQQEQVRVCPSTLGTMNTLDKTCSNCSVNLPSSVPTDLMSPLYIDTSFQPLSEESLDILMDENFPSKADKNVAEFFNWLNDDSKQQQQLTDSQTAESVSTFTEMPSQANTVSAPLDLESYVDLEDLMMPGTDMDDHTYQRTISTSKMQEDCVPQLKFSFLTELSNARQNSGVTRCNGLAVCHYSMHDQYRGLASLDSLTDDHSDLSSCASSPNWPSPDLSPSSSLSSPVSGMHCPAVRSQLALLNLFSDDNAASLLDTDSAVPNIRFM